MLGIIFKIRKKVFKSPKSSTTHNRQDFLGTENYRSNSQVLYYKNNSTNRSTRKGSPVYFCKEYVFLLKKKKKKDS